MARSVLVTIVLAGALLVAGDAGAGVDPALLCKETKAKTAGKKAFDLLKAFGKNVKKPNPSKLDQDVSKAKSKFTKGFSKADARTGCLTSDDSDAIEAKVDALVFEMVGNISVVCGDSIAAGDEECDGADDGSCPGDYVAPGGMGVCGDNIRNGPVECGCVTEQCDGTDDDACPGLCQVNCRCPEPVCGNGVLEAGEECEPPCSEDPPCGSGEICGVTCECVPKEPCQCGSPSRLEQSVEIQGGACGEMRDGAGGFIRDLDCSKSYIGGAPVGTPIGSPVSVGSTVYNVECCYGTSLVLTNSTAGETGSIETCSSVDCLTGSPMPLYNVNLPPGSVCIIEKYTTDAFGFADCSTGEVSVNMTVSPHSYISLGDLLRKRCDGGSGLGRACESAAHCVGGSKALKPCSDDSDCPGGTCGCPDGATCVDDPGWQICPVCNPVTLECNAGARDGLPCTPGTPELGPEYPTSNDCPPFEEMFVTATLYPWAFTTGTASKEAADGHFCRYCRDVEPSAEPGDTGSKCFEGDHRLTCPDSATSNCKPQSGDTSGCGTPVPCTVDADCFAPYETCEQRTAGGFNEPTARAITEWGAPAGDLRDWAPHDLTLATVFCGPPTFNQAVDGPTALPSPGASSLPGTLQMQP